MGKVEREEQDEDWGKKSVKLVLNMQVIGRILCWGGFVLSPPSPLSPSWTLPIQMAPRTWLPVCKAKKVNPTDCTVMLIPADLHCWHLEFDS